MSVPLLDEYSVNAQNNKPSLNLVRTTFQVKELGSRSRLSLRAA